MVYPPKCIFCGRLLGTERCIDICGGCYAGISFIDENPMPLKTGAGACGCDGVICVCRYTGIVKDSLIRFKFYNKPGYFRTFAKLLSCCIMKSAGDLKHDMLISVPLHKAKELSRGYNQAYLISKALSRELKIPERSDFLERIRSTDAQSLLGKANRLKNVKGAFRVTDREKVKGKSILLIDDILTTGFTVEECGKALKESGAASVTAAVVATGRKI